MLSVFVTIKLFTFYTCWFSAKKSVTSPGWEGVGSVRGGYGAEAARPRIGYILIGTSTVKITVGSLFVGWRVSIWHCVAKVQHVHSFASVTAVS